MTDKFYKEAVERLSELVDEGMPLSVPELADLTQRVANELREGKVVVIRTHDPIPKRPIPG